MLKKLRSSRDEETRLQIKKLNVEIRKHYTESKKHNIRRNISDYVEDKVLRNCCSFINY